MSEITQDLLRAILATLGRSAFGEEELIKIIGKSDKNRKAYLLCDGTKSQAEIIKAVKLDHGNFSRTVAKWVEEGIVFRLEDGKEAKLLRVRSLNMNSLKGI